MAKAFVHGNPETEAVWWPLVDALKVRGVDDVVLLSPPGFGAPVPDGWTATQESYRDWLVTELEALGGDVDVVGHDWGAAHLYGVLAERPELLRTWAADCAGLIHHDYVWHDMAQMWQTPDVGEEVVASMFAGSGEDRAAVWAGLGIREDIATHMAAVQDEVMGECLLGLYRSAAQPAMSDLGERLENSPQRPGLVFIATEDHYAGPLETAAEIAASLGAATLTLDGLDHWWMTNGAEHAADALIAHWARD